MNRNLVIVIAAGLILGSLAVDQNPPEKKPQASAIQHANELADALARRLNNDLHAKTVVGESKKIGQGYFYPQSEDKILAGDKSRQIITTIPAVETMSVIVDGRIIERPRILEEKGRP